MAASVEILRSCAYRLNAGFTLIELMMTIAISAILVTVAAPSFQTLILNARLSAKKNEFINALNLARSTALSQNSSITVCPLLAASSAACGTSWGAGWIIKTQPITGAPALVKAYQSSAKDAVLSAVAFNGTVATSLSFDSRGLSTTQANFKLCDSRGANFAATMQVLLTGFIQAGPVPGTPIWGGYLSCP